MVILSRCSADAVTLLQVGILQFSNDVHIQLSMGDFSKDRFDTVMADMVRTHSVATQSIWVFFVTSL